jgi:glycosyltransferase involved in cell wall biosynthesis
LIETRQRLAQLMTAKRYDVVFVQKAIMTAYLKGASGLLRRCARRLVFDFDDAVHLMPPHPLRFPWRLLEDRRQVERIIAGADAVLAGNEWLAEEARSIGAQSACFPTVVDTSRFVPACNEPEAYRIGWLGSPSTIVCAEPASEALGQVRDAALCFVGAEQKDVLWPGAEVRPWSLATEVAEVQRFSVGIMPMPEADWMRGKCALKALIYMACGIPCIASPFGAALEIIRHGENGLLANSTAEWLEAFERLRDPGERRRLGEAGRATVEERYSLQVAAPRLHALLEQLR